MAPSPIGRGSNEAIWSTPTATANQASSWAGRTLDDVLAKLERERESRWQSRRDATELKLRWRAAAVQHLLHILPGEKILEVGAGSGLLSEQLARVLQGENPVTSVVFAQELFDSATKRSLPNATFIRSLDLLNLPEETFDYVIGLGMLFQEEYSELLKVILRLLKPGGQLLFFEPNSTFPAFLFNELRFRGGWSDCARGGAKAVVRVCSAEGFQDVEAMPHDIVSCRLGLTAMRWLQAKAVVLEHMPGVRLGCASLCVLASKPGHRTRPTPLLANLPQLFGSVSVVIPAHNEATNIPTLIDRLLSLYGPYIHEIVIVNDNSKDATADVVSEIAAKEPRIRLVNRSMPNGVGLALRDGYQAATGKYILSMDCDFVEILPQMRSLFQAIADGRDGAIGSRFSRESILLNYPFAKLLFNRLCHTVIKLFLLSSVRDVTNNLKLYRSEILKDLQIRSPHFSANLETGLVPLLAGYDIVEVPTSWINRSRGMGISTFYLRNVGVAYIRALVDCSRRNRGGGRGIVQLAWRRTMKRLRLSR